MAIIVVAKAFWSSLYGKRVPDLMSVNICLMSSWAQSLILSDIQWKKCMSFTRFKKFICAHWLPGVKPVISQWANSQSSSFLKPRCRCWKLSFQVVDITIAMSAFYTDYESMSNSCPYFGTVCSTVGGKCSLTLWHHREQQLFWWR